MLISPVTSKAVGFVSSWRRVAATAALPHFAWRRTPSIRSVGWRSLVGIGADSRDSTSNERLFATVQNNMGSTSPSTADGNKRTVQQPKDLLPMNVLVIGVSGGIGSGKSTACRMLVSELCGNNSWSETDNSNTGDDKTAFVEAPAVHLDADSIAHGLYQPNGPVVEAIVNAFGPQVVVEATGEVNRPVLGAIIFNDPSARKKLEEIVWPLTRQEVWKRIESFATATSKASAMKDDDAVSSSTSGGDSRVPIVIVEAALLLEAGWEDFLDALWVITASRDVALERLVNGPRQMAMDDAERRMIAQEERPGLSPSSLEHELQRGIVTEVIDNSRTTDDLRCALQDALEKAKQIWREKNRRIE